MKRVTSLAVALISVALLALAGSSAAAVIAIARSNARVTEARAVVTEIAELNEVVAEQAYAEAGYRRSPSAESRRRLDAALAAVPPALRDLQASMGRTDAATLSNLAVINARYARQVRADADGPSTDDRVAGPALDAMHDLLDAMLERHRTNVSEVTEREADLIRTLSLLLPGVFVVAFGILGWAFSLSVRVQRRLHREAADAQALALTDALTGLPNRAALMAALSRCLAVPSPTTALLLLDLDRFKPVNDTWGHQAGDAVLCQVADRLREAIRPGDLAARLGGDEFAVLLPTGGDAVAVERRIARRFERAFDALGHPVEVGASIGIADVAAAGPDAGELLRLADADLYRVKRARHAGETPLEHAR